MQNKNTLFVPVLSLGRNQMLAERRGAKAAGKETMISISFQWTLTAGQILSLAVVSLCVVSWRGRNQLLQESCAASEAQG